VKDISNLHYGELQRYVYETKRSDFLDEDLEAILDRIWVLGGDYKNEQLYQVVTTELTIRFNKVAHRNALTVSIIALVFSLVALIK
jgi:hypothetical protein